MVEFALVLPILLLLTVGLVDVGRALHAQAELNNSVRDVGRMAAVRGRDAGVDAWGPNENDPKVEAEIRGPRRSVGLDRARIDVTSRWAFDLDQTPRVPSNDRGARVHIEATYAFRPVATAFLRNFNITLRSTTRTVIHN